MRRAWASPLPASPAAGAPSAPHLRGARTQRSVPSPHPACEATPRRCRRPHALLTVCFACGAAVFSHPCCCCASEQKERAEASRRGRAAKRCSQHGGDLGAPAAVHVGSQSLSVCQVAAAQEQDGLARVAAGYCSRAAAQPVSYVLGLQHSTLGTPPLHWPRAAHHVPRRQLCASAPWRAPTGVPQVSRRCDTGCVRSSLGSELHIYPQAESLAAGRP